jgi:hypothetical protein
MAEKDKNDPSNCSAAHAMMAPRLKKMRAVFGGTDAMRDCGEEYLPKNENESDARYDERLTESFLYNATALTLRSWVGRVFSEPIRHSESAYYQQEQARKLAMGYTPESLPKVPKLDPRIAALFPDIDLMGNSLDVVTREWFNTGMSYAVAPMLILNSTPTVTPSPGRNRTKADDLAEKVRPYWQMIAPENVLDVRTTTQGGREVVTHLRVAGMRKVYDGFREDSQETITVYGPNYSQVFLLTKVKRRQKQEWIPEAVVPHDYPEVPFVVFYAQKEETMVGQSAAFELADINIRHWQSYSSQQSCLKVARFPMLAGAGVPDEQVVVIGNRRFLRSELPEARFYYVEHGGAALESGEKDLQRLEDWMSAYGADFLKKKLSHVTAKDTELSSAEATSPISDVACRFNDAMAQALSHTARWMNIAEPEAGSVTVTTNLDSESDAPPPAKPAETKPAPKKTKK